MTKPFLRVTGLALALTVGAAAKAAGPAEAAFQKLRALAGEWTGTDARGNAVKTRFEPIAGGTAMMETLDMPGMEEMATLYSVDGGGIALVHYCPTNNQPHMRATPPAGDVRELVFEFQGAGNLPNLSAGHEHKLVMDFPDKDHLIEHWTWRQNGKDTPMVYHFARRAGS